MVALDSEFSADGTLGISSHPPRNIEVNIWSKTLPCCSLNSDNIGFEISSKDEYV